MLHVCVCVCVRLGLVRKLSSLVSSAKARGSGCGRGDSSESRRKTEEREESTREFVRFAAHAVLFAVGNNEEFKSEVHMEVNGVVGRGRVLQ